MHGNMMELTVPKSARGPHTNRDFKLVVVGHRAVGKSAMVVRFLTKRFISEYLENSEMTCNGVVEVDGEKLKLNIQDTSEKGIRVPTVDHHFRWADAIMLVYSVTDKMSYQRLRYATMRLKEKLAEHETLDAKIPAMVVVGNKGDLEHMRQVSQSDGMQLADELGCRFFESSASEGWSKLVSHAYARDQPSPKPLRKSSAVVPQRPTTLPLSEKSTRRMSDPSIIVHSVSDVKQTKSPLNDLNNNAKANMRVCPPLLAVPVNNVPHISISPSDENQNLTRNSIERTSRGKRLMQKLSPRFSRKFGHTNKSPPKGMSHIGASLARVGSAGLAVGHLNNEKSMTLPSRASPHPSFRKSTLDNIGRTNGMLLDSSSSSSSNESLNISAKFFLRPETPTTPDTDISPATSSDEELSTNSDATITNVPTFNTSENDSSSLRRSASFCRNLNLLQIDRQYNSDSDSSKEKLSDESEMKTKLCERLSNSFTTLNVEEPTLLKKEQTGPKDILLEKKFNSSEPFTYLCREARNTRRMRDRKTPTRFLRDGFRKIRSLATDQSNHNQGPIKQNGFHVAAVRH